MNRSPLVSIIIPAYNYDRYIKTCIEGLLRQTYPSIEIVIVDDGSTDNTANVIQEFSSDKIKYLFQENSGPAAARNRGIRNASGEYVVFLDADDLLSPNYVESQIKTILHNKDCQVAISENRMFSDTDDNGKPIVTGRWKIGKSHYDTHILFFNICPPHSLMYHRSLIEAVGLFNAEIKGCEDYEYILRAIASGAKMQYNPAGCAYYRQHQLNRSKEKSRVYRSDIEMHRMVLRLAKGGNLPAYYTCAGRYAFIAGMLTTFNRIDVGEVEGGDSFKEMLLEEIENTIHLTRSFSKVEILYAKRLKKCLVAVLRERKNELHLSSAATSYFSVMNLVWSYMTLFFVSMCSARKEKSNRYDC